MRLAYVGNGQALPGFEHSSTRAAWPVWKGTANITKTKIRPAPAMTRKEAARLYRQLEDFEGATRLPGRQDGAIGRNGLAVARAFLWRFLNWRTGRLDPSHAEIARKAHISPRSVARGLDALRRAGVLQWVRRCIETTDKAGRFALAQISNLYAFRAVKQWIGFTAEDKPSPAEPPPPDAIALGLVEPIERGTVAAGTFDRDYELIELKARAAAGEGWAAALLRLGEALKPEPASISSELPIQQRNPTEFYNS